MPIKRQYHYDKKRAEINRLEISKRKSRKWKQLERLAEIREKESKWEVLFNLAIHEYEKINRVADDDEIRKLSEKCIVDASDRNRKALRRLFFNEVVDVPLADIKPSNIEEGKSPMNIRTYRTLKKDINYKGIINPLLITDSCEIIDGHQRYYIAKELGIKELPCRIVYLKYVTEHQKYRIILELRFSLNVGRRHLTMKEDTRMRRLWKTFFTEKAQPGRPSKKMKAICTDLQVRDLPQISEIDRHLARLYGINDI